MSKCLLTTSRTIPYVILRKERIIRVYQGNLSQPWWNREPVCYERDIQSVSRVLRQIAGFQHVYRRRKQNHIDFMIGNQEKFDSAAVALQLQITQDKRAGRLVNT